MNEDFNLPSVMVDSRMKQRSEIGKKYYLVTNINFEEAQEI